MAAGVVHAERHTPIVDYQGDLAHPQRLDETLDVARVVDETVGDVWFVRLSHADQVKGDASALLGDTREHIAPQVGGGRIAVEEENGITIPDLEVVHSRSLNVDEPGGGSGLRLSRDRQPPWR